MASKGSAEQSLLQGLFQRGLFGRRNLFFICSALLSVVVLYWIFSAVSVSQVVELIANAHPIGILFFVSLSLLTTFFRAWRYHVLLRVTGYSPAWSGLFLVTLVRNLCADLLPARIGDALYIFFTNTRLNIPAGEATSSFAISFLFDLLALVPLLFVCALVASTEHSPPIEIIILGGIVIFLLAICLVRYLETIIDWTQWALQKSTFLPSQISSRLQTFAQNLSAAIRTTKSARVFIPVFFLSLGVRCGKYATLYMLLWALLSPLGYGFTQLSFTIVILGICVAEMFASLPISGIAGIGSYQVGWALAFSTLGFDSHLAKLTAISHHLLTQAWGYGIGLCALVLLALHKPRNPNSEATKQHSKA